ncbi:MAG: Zn-dependent exopeptidase M28 [Clostridia bacterium]|nr:Zn-dependent exopeptidase M28 [Clostridia bacterium]
MNEDNKKYVDEAYEIIRHASLDIGSRLPGSENERKFANYMGDKLREIGINPVKEVFSVSPRSSIGGIPYAGWAGVILSVASYFAQDNPYLWYPMAALGLIVIIWLIASVFLYSTCFDMFFKQKISQNVYGEITPEDGEYDYTIILSGHTDTSWNWKHSEHAYKYKDKPILGIITTYGKVGFGAICYFFIALTSIFMAVLQTMVMLGNQNAMILYRYNPGFQNFRFAMYFLPIICAIGCFFVIMWNDGDEKNASKGAMDNASGIALSYEVIKYFKENPDKLPERCRIIDLNCGSEEAGLRGSMAFTSQHKGEPILENAWNINSDSVADKDYFEVVIKDDWQFTRFDTDLEKMFKDTFEEMEIESKTGGCIHNPVGGCDSTPMTKAGIKSVTFAAQNPILTWYYHTFRDLPDRFEAETVGTGFEVILSVINKISEFQKENGYNGPQKK